LVGDFWVTGIADQISLGRGTITQWCCVMPDRSSFTGWMVRVWDKHRLNHARLMCGRGEIGRRSGLKIRFPRWSAGSSPAVRTIFTTVLLALLASCGAAEDRNRTAIAMIGALPRSVDPDRRALNANDALLARETAQGLVALDANGQIEPAIAESWIVTDNGLSIIFRIQPMTWPDGRELTSEDVAASLRRAIAPGSRNSLRPFLSAVSSIVSMTGRVVEIRLKSPQPDLLQLLAQPELGIRSRGMGSGPWRVMATSATALTLTPTVLLDSSAPPEEMRDEMRDGRRVTVRSGRPAMAVARFMGNGVNAVFGGSFADWPIITVAGSRQQDIRVDVAEGLFGVGIVPRTPFLRDRLNRAAITMVIDQVELVRLFNAGRWKAADRLLPGQLDSAQPPKGAEWLETAIEDRILTARQRIARWIASNGPVAPLRLAAPDGPGTTLLVAKLNADLQKIAIQIVHVPSDSIDADLRLVDALAPYASADWYLTRTGCEAGFACSDEGQVALDAARDALTLAARAQALATADAAYADAHGYIPLARPLRWSLISRQLTGFRDSVFAVHPLSTLRSPAAN
jgi:oligopeptide transport system substrate-binding protein